MATMRTMAIMNHPDFDPKKKHEIPSSSRSVSLQPGLEQRKQRHEAIAAAVES